jgi:hypothetical protein
VLVEDEGVGRSFRRVPERFEAFDVEGLRDSFGTARMKAVRHGSNSLNDSKWAELLALELVVLVDTEDLREVAPNLVTNIKRDRLALGCNNGGVGCLRASLKREVPAKA